MTLHARIAKSFELNKIERVLIIDDAYDLPAFNSEISGSLMELMRDNKEEIFNTIQVNDEDIAEATESLNDGDLENDKLTNVIKQLYELFVERREEKHDLDRHFGSIKGAALDALIPLEKFLLERKETKLERVGLADAQKRFDDFKPQIVFLDFFLSADLNESGSADDQDHADARKESIALLKRLVSEAPGSVPAVVLMSSKDMSSKKDEFRREAQPEVGGPKIVSWRFHFLQKNGIELRDSKPSFTPEAADALLDTCQSYRFGKQLHQTLDEWKRGLDRAVDNLTVSIADLDIKDFAYLMRFRLREEGQPLSQYLNWLFSESLVETIGASVDWGNEAFSALDKNEGGMMNPIEGAYDGPTVGIAKMFDRARIERRVYKENESKKLGDIFRVGDTEKIRAIVTPDCDLVVRKGIAKVSRPLTVGGLLKSYDSPVTPLTDFIIVDEKFAHSIEWDAKDLEATDFSSGTLHYMGTLRPIYAQEMQRMVLTDLGRVGVAVPPVIGMTAKVSVHIRIIKRKKKYENPGTKEIDFGHAGRANCTIMPSRNGMVGASIIFHREFVHRLISKLEEYPKEDLTNEVKSALNNAVSHKSVEEIYQGFCIDGIVSNTINKQNISIVFGGKLVTSGDDIPWCQILIEKPNAALENDFFSEGVKDSAAAVSEIDGQVTLANNDLADADGSSCAS